MKKFYYYPEDKVLIPVDEAKEIGVLVYLGENQKENDTLVKECDGCDTWFHVADHPSGHAIYTGDDPSNDAVARVASLVKEQSKLKNLKKVKVNYILLKHVKPTKTLGQVVLTKSPDTVIV
jgi:predicted ribosome quality control (RQC) complex YloA/Tae2 family protein